MKRPKDFEQGPQDDVRTLISSKHGGVQKSTGAFWSGKRFFSRDSDSKGYQSGGANPLAWAGFGGGGGGGGDEEDDKKPGSRESHRPLMRDKTPSYVLPLLACAALLLAALITALALTLPALVGSAAGGGGKSGRRLQSPTTNMAKWAKKAAPAQGMERLTIGAVGDIRFEELTQSQAQRHASYQESWQALVPLLKAPDITYGNLEGTVAEGMEAVAAGCAEQYYYFNTARTYMPNECAKNNVTWTDIDHLPNYKKQGLRSPWVLPDEPWLGVYSSDGPFQQFNYHPNLAASLGVSGFDVVSTANTHGEDRGEEGMARTIRALQAETVQAVGTRASTNETDLRYTTVQRGNWTTAWVACTDDNGVKYQHRTGNWELMWRCWDTDFLRLIVRLAEDPEIHVVVGVANWGEGDTGDGGLPKGAKGDDARELGYEVGYARGNEHQRQPDCSMRAFARAMADAGAAVVLSNHPHMVHPMEKYHTPDARTVLLTYSLGNFVSSDGFVETHHPPSFLGRGFVSNETDMALRTSVFLHLGLEWDPARNVAEVACLSYVPIFRHLTQELVDVAAAIEYRYANEVHLLQADMSASRAAERAFIAEHFGFLREGGGFVGNIDDQGDYIWESIVALRETAEERDIGLQCHDWASVEASTVSRTELLHPETNVVVQEADGPVHMWLPAPQCLKCERSFSARERRRAQHFDLDPECHWCLVSKGARCSDREALNSTDQWKFPVEVLKNAAWDDCLAAVQADEECGHWVIAGGSDVHCRCLLRDEHCAIHEDAEVFDSAVYVWQCPGHEVYTQAALDALKATEAPLQ